MGSGDAEKGSRRERFFSDAGAGLFQPSFFSQRLACARTFFGAVPP